MILPDAPTPIPTRLTWKAWVGLALGGVVVLATLVTVGLRAWHKETLPQRQGLVVHKTVGIDLKEEAAPSPPNHSGSMIIRNGDMTLKVRDLPAVSRQVEKVVKELGGFISSTHQSQYGEGPATRNYCLGIPADRFDHAGGTLRSLGQVIQEGTTSEDVSQAYADLETRLRVKRDAAQRIRELLQGRTANLKDVLEAEAALQRLTEEIETTEGQRRGLAHKVSFSTLTLTLTEDRPSPGLFQVTTAGFREGLTDTLRLLLISISVMFKAALVLAPWAGVIWGVLWMRRKRARAKVQPPTAD